MKKSHFSLKGPWLNAETINRPIERDSSARLHSMPHHIKAMERGMMVFFMKEPVVVKKKQNFYAAVNSPKLDRKTGIYS